MSLIYYNIFCNPQWSMTLKYGFQSGARLRSSRTVQVRTFLKGLLRNSQEVAAELLLGPLHDQFVLLSAARATMELLQMVLNVGIQCRSLSSAECLLPAFAFAYQTEKAHNTIIIINVHDGLHKKEQDIKLPFNSNEAQQNLVQ